MKQNIHFFKIGCIEKGYRSTQFWSWFFLLVTFLRHPVDPKKVVGEDVGGVDDDAANEVGEVVGEDVGGAGLWQESDPINLVHTCPRTQQEPA